MELLASCAADVRAAGYAIGNVDATIVVDRPKLAPHSRRCATTSRRGSACDRTTSSVKAKSSEGLGYTGDGSGIAAYAVAC